MLGIGVGFDTKGAQENIVATKPDGGFTTYVIPGMDVVILGSLS